MVERLVFRGRGDTMKQGVGLAITLPSGPLPPRSSRLFCVLAALAAFLVGVVVGVAIPMVLAHHDLHHHTANRPLMHHDGTAATEIGLSRRDAAPIDNFIEENMHPVQPFKKTDHQQWLNANAANLSSTEEEDEDEEFGDIADRRNAIESEALLVDGVYWGTAVEAALPDGFSDGQVDAWRRFTRRQAIVRLQEGCGRMQNRLVTFENGTQSCCRYRQNHDQIQGEIFSFYLSRLLGINNVPPSVLGLVRAQSWQWMGVRNQLALAQWAEDRPVVMTRYVQDLQPAYIPVGLRAKPRRLHPLDVEEHDARDLRGLAQLAQWSDLIIFDYLTANLDRVVNNLYNTQWNPSMMEAPAHNLATHGPSGLLVFLDNESGLLHGYRLLDKYENFHASLLHAICVFRQSTGVRVRQLVERGDVGSRLRAMYKRHEPDLLDFLPSIPDKSIKILNERLKSVHKQISKCEKLYMNQ
ncbi:four-jointed box kinase [Oratosquilla oratoria]|uniref:four-jointed box kinase n=1 Tax=Oratosquilla oratoria TaxID=337810 RepID=UPI003F75EF2E